MPKEFIMRGKTASGGTEKLDFGHQARLGYGYQIREFTLFPSASIGGTDHELTGTISCGTTAITPTDPDFNDDALIASSIYDHNRNSNYGPVFSTVLNDLFVITQDLILMVQDAGGGSEPVNWQCRFEEIKLSTAAEAVANFKQYSIYNTSQ